MVRAQRSVAAKDAAKQGSDHSVLERVSDEEFYMISEKALKSAVRLVAWASGLTEESLRARYFDVASHLIHASEADPENLHHWERDAEDPAYDQAQEPAASGDGPEAICKDLLDDVMKDVEAACSDEKPMPEGPAANSALDSVSGLPDADALQALFKMTGDASCPFQSEHPESSDQYDAEMGTTLSSALRQCAEHFSGDPLCIEHTDAIFDSLWRLLMYLRHWRGGCDRHFLKNAKACRNSARTTHWYK